jgi:hypothetical protein
LIYLFIMILTIIIVQILKMYPANWSNIKLGNSLSDKDKHKVRHGTFKSVCSLIPNQYCSISMPQLNYKTISNMIMVKTDIRHYYGDKHTLHDPLNVIPITDLRKLIIEYLICNKIDVKIRIDYHYGQFPFYDAYCIIIKLYNNFYTFKYNRSNYTLRLRVDLYVNPNIYLDMRPDSMYFDYCQYNLTGYYTLSEMIKYINNEVIDITDPIYDALIIFDHIFGHAMEILKSKNLFIYTL